MRAFGVPDQSLASGRKIGCEAQHCLGLLLQLGACSQQSPYPEVLHYLEVVAQEPFVMAVVEGQGPQCIGGHGMARYHSTTTCRWNSAFGASGKCGMGIQ